MRICIYENCTSVLRQLLVCTADHDSVDLQGERQRITICVSSQIGCAMNCQFCYTGRMGLK